MEKNLLIQKLNKILSSSLLKVTRFGKSNSLLLWIASPSLEKVANLLKEDHDLRLDWLENLSVAEIDGLGVLSYFLRSTQSPVSLILRLSEELEKSGAQAGVPSVRKIWPMSIPMEAEIEELFGIHFDYEGRSVLRAAPSLLWKGYPLRKNYQFPKIVEGIEHTRQTKLSLNENKVSL